MKRKFISALLCVAIMFSVMPIVSAQATTDNIEYISSDENVVQATSEPYIMYELIEKRTENTKHFLMSDRSIMASMYDEAVHYNDNGAWIDIDNSFSTNSENEFENKNNSFKTKFSKKSNGNKLVTIKKDNYSVSWMLDAANKVNAKISQKNESETEDISVLKNLEGTVSYPKIQNDVDLQYVVSGENIKENIILQSAEAPTEYSFTYKFNKLQYRTNDNNQIEFYDESDSQNVIFIIDKPYMYDSANAYSSDIEMKISKTNNGFKLTLVPNKEWLQSEDRVYPIVIDPTTLSNQKATSVWDIEVRNTQTSAFWYKAGDFLVGSDANSQIYRTLLKFCDLPNIGIGGIVVNAKMNITAYQGPAKDGDPALRTRPTDDIQVNVHRITANWPEQGVVWNDYANSYNPTVEDYFIYNNTSEVFSADITKLVSGWYSGEYNNYGVMLKANNEAAANHVMQFASSDWGINDTNSATWRPILYVNYRTCIGLEDYWSYTTQDMGGYGTGYVNNYNGNLTYIHNDVSFNSLINGFTLSHVYNTANSINSTGRYGRGWGLNLVQTFEPVTIENNTAVRFVYTDGDGTKHYFVQLDDGSIVDEDGLGYTFSSISEGELIYKLTDKDKNVLKFDQWYFLRRIIDSNGNTISLNYSPGTTADGNYLTSITTSSGGWFALNYDSNCVLMSITDNANRVTGFSYTNGNLTKITYPDGTDLDFEYCSGVANVAGSTSWLHGVILPNGYQYRYGNYYDGKIFTSAQVSATETQVNNLYYTYLNNKTTVQDLHNRHINYLFDSFGRVTCTYDSEGNSYSESYTPTLTTKGSIFKNNKLSTNSNNIKHINNLLTNGVFTNDLSSWTPYIEAPNETQISVVGDQTYISPKSVKITSTASGIQALLQSPSTTAGKTYTISANIKTENIVSSIGRGAAIEVVTNTSSGQKWYMSDFVSGTTDTLINDGYKKLTVTVNLAPDEYILRIGVGLYHASGTVWIDSVQVEEGDTANAINLISNSSFENGTSSFITNFGSSTGNGASTAQNQSGSYSCQIAGYPSQTRSICQRVNISGKAGDVYSLGGWGKANSVPTTYSNLNLKPNFRMYLNVYNGSSVVESYEIKFNEYISDWQYVSKAVVLKNNYTMLEVFFTYDYNCNTAYFDDMFLYRDTAQSYTYDENGNVISTADYAKQQSTFEYTDNNLSKTVEPTGTKYTYKYDSENNLVNAWSNVGVDYNIAYDSYGNATKTTIVPNDPSQFAMRGAYYIKNKSSGQYLTIRNNCITSTGVAQQPLIDSPLQRWRIQTLSNGNIIIIPEDCDNHMLTYRYAISKSDVILGSRNSTSESLAWCQWRLISNNDDEGSFKIRTTYSSCTTPYVSISASNRTTGGKVHMSTISNTGSEDWILVPVFNAAITSSATYQNNGNYPHTVTDSRGNTTTYSYDTTRGLQTGVTDALGNSTTYSYNSLNDRLDSVTSGSSTVQYGYDSNNILQSITSTSGTVYNFAYDGFGNTTNISVGTQSLTTNTYDTVRGLLKYSVYGNGQKIGYTYDLLDRVTEKLYNDVVKVKFRYDKFGNLYEKQDLFTNTTYRYSYDLIGRITGVSGSNGTSLNYVYDQYNRTQKYIAKFADKTNNTEYIYGDSDVSGQKDGLIYGVKQNGIQRISYAYDLLARLNTRTLNTTTPFVTQYNYHQGATAGTTTTLVKTVQNGSDTYEYAYDAVGNITQIKKNGTVYESYTYDSLNQLKTVIRGSDVYEYTYDNGGNIQSVTLNGETIKSYGYTDTNWKDKLTSFNGQTITYDNIGNPLTYRDGYSFAWSNGRQLTGITKGTDSISYLYNADGLRASKTVNGTTTDYYWLEGVLLGQKTGNDYITYLYDENGAAYGIICNDTYYYYVFNAQGDVIGIIDADGNQVVQYDYSAWGEVLAITGTMADTLGQTNPIRYRGYYYDSETGFYLTGTRYYDPEIGRFINADNQISGVGSDIRGYNLFAYCFNNPVNMSDPTGNWPRWITATVAAVAAVVAVVATVVSAPVVATAAAAVAVVSTVAYVAQSHHYDKRKAKNTSVPKTYDEAMKKDGADNTISAACHQFTAGDEPNKKVCWPDGTEGIYNSSGELVLDPRDVGTYNFSVPNGGWSSVWHGVVDVVPWIIFGNDDDDNTWMYQRVISLFNGE